MTEPDAGSTTPPSSKAPGSRIRPRFVVAVTIAIVMFIGVIGLLSVAVLGDDDDPTGVGLEREVNVDEPATAPPGSDDGGSTAAPSNQSGTAAPVAGGSTEPQATGEGDDAQSGEAATTTTAQPAVDTASAVNSLALIEEGDEAPPQPDEPVEFPTLVTNPAPPTTFAAVPLGELGATSVPALDGWSVSSRAGDHVAFANNDQVLDVFVVGEAVTAVEAMNRFYDDRVGSDLGDVTESPITLLGAPSERFVSVAGSQYVATAAQQQGTVVVSGSAVTAVGADGGAVVIATSRLGVSSAEELATDGELLRSLLAHL